MIASSDRIDDESEVLGETSEEELRQSLDPEWYGIYTRSGEGEACVRSKKKGGEGNGAKSKI